MFYESWGFWLIIGLVIGGCFGFILAAILAASGRASRQDYVYRGRREEK
jgi:hypothetical protein